MVLNFLTQCHALGIFENVITVPTFSDRQFCFILCWNQAQMKDRGSQIYLVYHSLLVLSTYLPLNALKLYIVGPLSSCQALERVIILFLIVLFCFWTLWKTYHFCLCRRFILLAEVTWLSGC